MIRVRRHLPLDLQASILTIAAIVVLSACTSFSVGYQTGAYAGRTISAASPEGADYLELVSELDGGVRDVVAEYGNPAYITVVDTSMLYFFYPDSDMVVLLNRDESWPNSTRTEHSPIPEAHLGRLGIEQRRNIESKRREPRD